MNYAEAAYFDRNACQHVVDYLDHLRLARTVQRLDDIRRANRPRNRAFA